MAVKNLAQEVSDSYFTLVKRFPLTCIQDDDHLDAAQEMIDQLLQQELDSGAQAYLDVVTDLVERYEDEHHAIPDASEAEVLRALMQSNQFSQARLARATQIAQSTISAVLTGGRSLTKNQVVKLARFFGISAAAFLPLRDAPEPRRIRRSSQRGDN